MLALPLLAALSTTAAADDALSVEALVQTNTSGEVAPGGGIRLDVGRLFIAGEGRGLGAGDWTGRATAGLDLLAGSDRFDLTIGAFAGMTGGVVPEFQDPAATYGFEAGLGASVGRFNARYRRAMGLSGPLAGLLTEDELRLGLRLGEEERFNVFGQAVHFRAGEAEGITGLGGGLSVAF